MKILALCLTFLVVGCAAASWQYTPVADIEVEHSVPGADVCAQCHEQEHNIWAGNKHGDLEAMSPLVHDSLKQCGACHEGLKDHVANSGVIPASISQMSKTQQNALCGKCHFDMELMGNDAINPTGKHSPIMSVGFDESYKRQLSCLDCHSGHSDKGDMLKNTRAHVCFTCHKEAIVTMGIFQPFNYLAAGKVCTTCHAAHGGTGKQLTGRVLLGTSVCLPCHM